MNNRDYSELYGVLLMLGKSYIMKLPDDTVQYIKNNRDFDYEPEYSIDSIKYEEDLSSAVLECLADFHLKYWQDSE